VSGNRKLRSINIRLDERIAQQIDGERDALIEAEPAVSYSFSDAMRRVIVRGLAKK
jgi:hypothetical protein